MTTLANALHAMETTHTGRTPPMTDLNTLAEQVERAAAPSRELDEAIALATGWRQEKREYLDGARILTEWVRPDGFRLPIGTMAEPPFFTASLDAALTLVPEGWDWMVERLKGDGSFAEFTVNLSPEEQPYPVELERNSEAATPALALTAASLRAHAAKEGK